MKFSRLALALVLFVAVAGLSAVGQEKDQFRESPYYPLQVGNTWNYKLGDMKFTMRVAKHEKVGEALCARVEMSIDGKVQAYEHIAVTADGIYRHSFEGKKAEPPVRFLKLPPKKGETWEVNSKVGGESLKGTFKAGEEDNVKVPAGTYKTVTSATDDLDANGTKISFKYYFAENVGMVKQDLDIAGQKAVIELEKYEPAVAGKAPDKDKKTDDKAKKDKDKKADDKEKEKKDKDKKEKKDKS